MSVSASGAALNAIIQLLKMSHLNLFKWKSAPFIFPWLDAVAHINSYVFHYFNIASANTAHREFF